MNIIGALFGLVPLLQFGTGGWVYFIASLLIYIIGYNAVKGNGYKPLMFMASTVVVVQLIMYFAIPGNNFALVMYNMVSAMLIFVGSRDEKKLDDLKDYLKTMKIDTKNWDFKPAYFSYSQIEEINGLDKLSSCVVGIGKEGIAVGVKMPKGVVNKFISMKDIIDYSMYKITKNQELYYPTVRDMFLPSRRLTTLHKPQIEAFGLVISASDDEKICFYEEPQTINIFVEKLDEATMKL